MITNLVFMALVPLTVLVTVNTRLYRLLRQTSASPTSPIVVQENTGGADSFCPVALGSSGRASVANNRNGGASNNGGGSYRAAGRHSPVTDNACRRLRARARRDRTVAAMFIVIVVVFVFCHSLKYIINFYEMCKVMTVYSISSTVPIAAFFLCD